MLYVGKAKALRKRVANYLRPAAQPHGRTGEMLVAGRRTSTGS